MPGRAAGTPGRSGPLRAVRIAWRRAVAASTLSPSVWAELLRERTGGHPPADHRAHLEAAIDWLCRAQDATPDDGFARGYSLTRLGHFPGPGWQPSYPETTGYIIPTLYMAAEVLERPDLAARAERAARWEIDVQLESGAVRGGVIGEPEAPAVFNTGQVLFGWLSAFEATGDERFAAAADRAARWLCSVQESDGLWSRGNSPFARGDTTLYNARAAWGLAEVGARLERPAFTDAAARSLRAVAARQCDNGWFPDCCLTDPNRPLLHTLAYTTRGLLEGGRVLRDGTLIDAATRSARALADRIRSDGWLPGRFHSDWSPAARWSCLTGQAQMASVWLNLCRSTGERAWLEPARASIRYVKTSHSLRSREPGLRGGIRGSMPMTGEYGRLELLNWATKFFADALIRDDLLASESDPPSPHADLA